LERGARTTERGAIGLENVYEIADELQARIGALESSLSAQIAAEHGATRQAVREVGTAVAEGNALLNSIKLHPHDSVKLLTKAGALTSVISILFSAFARVDLLSPPFAVTLLLASGLFWAMALADEAQRRRAGRR
jgi:hypothetical protein